MTSEQAAQPRPLRPRAKLGLAIGVLLVVTGAGLYQFRIGRPAYRLTPTQASVHLSLADHPEAGRQRVVPLAFVNTGRHPLKLARVDTSCGCTVVKGVPADEIAPDAAVSFDVAVTLPAYGDQRTSITVETDPPSPQPIEVALVMQGASVETPYVNQMPESFELTTRQAGEAVEHVIEVETGEAIDSDPWLTGLETGDPRASFELLGHEDARMQSAAGIINRWYRFRLSARGPDSPYEPISFPVRPIGTSQPMIAPPHCMISLVYRPAIHISPQRLLVVLGEDARFPQTRTLAIAGSDEQPLPGITNVHPEAEWITAHLVPAEANSAEREVQLTINRPHQAAQLFASQSEVVISLDDDAMSALHVPISIESNK